ncbi:DUF4870 family protein [Glycocaulis abyssi]|jgi:uncharacterized membrane protein|uniref:DUF4870 family protein n=1 Tax=Glycocaulis abyssi TaxID=1433403 RepID=A0ABV9NBC9_9PROT|nr:hypothetical protein [Synechococcus moorigangaii CMS01]
MTEEQTTQAAPPPAPGPNDTDRTFALVCYILQILSVVTGLTAIVAVILAYVRMTEAPEWIKNHYVYQIRTFWYGLAGMIIGVLTIWLLGLGLLIMLATAIWFIVRAVVGLIRLTEGRTHTDPRGFWI